MPHERTAYDTCTCKKKPLLRHECEVSRFAMLGLADAPRAKSSMRDHVYTTATTTTTTTTAAAATTTTTTTTTDINNCTTM